MKPRGKCASRLAIGLCGLGAAGWLCPAHSQSAAAAADAPAAPVYQDRYFATAAPDISNDVDATSDAAGLARSLQIDGVVSALGL